MNINLTNLVYLFIAAIGEISGCFSFWVWLRLGKSIFWIIPGVCALIIFAITLTKVDLPNAARVYAAYGGIYLLSSLLWLWLVEGVKPNTWDIVGVGISVLGTVIILWGAYSNIK